MPPIRLLTPHVWTAPCWQGFFDGDASWSVLPCVRPVDAALFMAAGHNALVLSILIVPPLLNEQGGAVGQGIMTPFVVWFTSNCAGCF